MVEWEGASLAKLSNLIMCSKSLFHYIAGVVYLMAVFLKLLIIKCLN